MSTVVTFNSLQYTVPSYNDTGYAQGNGNLCTYLVALATGTLQPSGGLFQLTADADFGPNFGIKSLYYKSETANGASAGVMRLAVTDTIDFRNNANSGNLALGINGSDQLTFNSTLLLTPGVTVAQGGTGVTSMTAYALLAGGTTSTGAVQSLAGVGSSGQVLTSNGASALPTFQNVTGTGTVNSGTANHLTYYATSTNTVSSLAAITASRALVSDTNGLPVAATTTTTELNYVSGVTSAIQTQLNSKAPTAAPTFTGVFTAPGFLIDSSSRVLIGPSSSRTVNGTEATLQVESTTAAGARPSIVLNINSASCPELLIGKSRGGTNGSSTLVQNGDFLGVVYFMGANGVDMNSQGAGIFVTATGTPSATSMPAKMELQTTPVGSIACLTGLTINPDQTVNVAAKNGLQVAGNQTYPIVQVVSSGTALGATTTASASFVDTLYTVSISPKFNTSKLLVNVSGYYYNDTGTAGNNAEIQLSFSGGYSNTDAYRATSNPSGGFDYANAAFCTQVSPATTSAITIKIQIRRNSGTGNATFASNQGSIVVQEIAQ